MPELSKDQLTRLRSSMEWSYRKLKPFREKRKEIIEQFVGMHYGEHGVAKPVPLNLLGLALRIYQRSLVARNPKVMSDTEFVALKPKAYDLELAGNHLLGKIGMAKTLRCLVQEALISVGILKVAMHVGGALQLGDSYHDIGQPYADVVELPDWVHDMTARTYEQCAFAGNRYRLPISAVMDTHLYEDAGKQVLKPNSQSDRDEMDPSQEDKAEALSRGSGEAEELYESVDLWDIWLRHENLIVTLAPGNGPPLRVVEWSGPECGPFHMLAFEDVPSNVMPKPPAADWMDIHITVNRLLRKLNESAENQKTILGYQSQGAKDAERIQKANHGEIIKMDFPDKAREFNFNGVNNSNLAYLIQLKELFSYNASNLEVLGGLGAQAGTLGQEQLLTNSTNKQISEMQDRFIEFTGKVVRDLIWYLWDDPLIDIPLTKHMPGYESVSVQSRFTPESRSGDFLDYNIHIQPYSMQHQTPEMRVQAIMEIVGQTILPALPMLQQQGLDLNWEVFLRKIGHYKDIVDLEELIVFKNAPAYGGAPTQPPQVPKPAATTRTNVRVNKSVGTRQGNDAAMMQTLMAQGDGHSGIQQRRSA